MNFTLHQLKIFTVIVEKKSITKASEILNMTQPAVSIQLKNFQDQFDMPLTEIISRKLFVTDFGEEVYRIAIKILEDAEALSYKTETFKGKLTGKLKISVVSTGKYVMPYYLKDFLKLHPDIDLLMDVTNRRKVINSLELNEVDFALVSVLPDKIEVEEEILMPDKLFLIAAPAENVKPDLTKPYNKSIFEKIPLIYREEGSATRQKMEQYFTNAHIKPKIKLELATNEAIKQAVMAGIGCSIVSILSIKNELKEKALHILPVKGLPIRSNWMLVWNKKKKFSLVAESYLTHLRSNKTKIYADHFSWVEKI